MFTSFFSFSQQAKDSVKVYKKRVLETTEVDFLTSYYSQDGDNAAVSGGVGTEELTDITANIIVSIPLNDDDVLTLDTGISAYTSASSSNVNPFDKGTADPFQASTGASSSDLWFNFTGNYSHSSDDRNQIWAAKASVSSEFDYSSIGFGGSYTRLFNEKNTELSISANIYLDTWKTIYPYELRPFSDRGDGINDALFIQNTVTGNPNYNPIFNDFSDKGRNSYSFGLGFSQILHKNVQGSLAFDLTKQSGLLSTPFQRVYFSDIDDSFIDNFQLADANEKLPNNRLKIALGGRLNWYLNELLTIRTFYRYYFDDWGINSHTASIEIPVKITDKFTLYPSYRFYNQTAADYFAAYEKHLSTNNFYTSDYDLSKYSSNQFGFGVSYTDIFSKAHIWKFGLKSIDVKFYKYDRNTTFNSSLITAGFKFIMD
ncbi:hypothetical protein CSC81_01590 [Tenacibaculum discolor]|uniref:DUF3570 domain-containing protein n=1 Tax=Tenacibaculum discolor TaxID=361581 RepID=A0A2G1BYE4_9FLAO|nr:DUF3570 domain-containing protein [Tenacibaculum discolor]MDP2541194.1 DUF3570 domain-containing protein [Tenacibaculum discolor]PHN99036.1 hypothetical protein CSC81_01590 [Tenacibaculum discolor]PHO01232.1 hypothetical protein CSC82_24680 [Rhodobacteraceae bacterium 4F10]